MIIKKYINGFIFSCFISILFSQEQIPVHLITSQSIVLPGESVYIGVLTSSELFVKNKAPILHLFLQNQSMGTLGHWSLRPEKSIFITNIKIPYALTPDSYVLSLVLFDESINSVIAEDDRMVHVWGKTIGTLKSFENIERDVDLVMKAAKTRENLCIDPTPNSFVSFVDASLTSFGSSRQYFNKNKIANVQRNLSYKIKSPNQNIDLQMMYDHHKNNVYQVKYQDLTYGLLTTEDFKGDRPVQWVHAMDMKIESTLQEEYPSLQWQSQELKPMMGNSAEFIEATFEKLRKRLVLKNIFDTEETSNLSVQKISRLPDETNADNIYEVDKYQPFETLPLFFKEIIFPVKVIEKKSGRDLRIFKADAKEWFSGSPMLILDGSVQSNLNAFFNLSYENVKSIRLFRSKENLIKQFGSLGRNGVLEIITKTHSFETPSVHLAGLLESSPKQNSPQWIAVSEMKLNGLQYFAQKDAIGNNCMQLNDESGKFQMIQYIFSDDKLSVNKSLYEIKPEAAR